MAEEGESSQAARQDAANANRPQTGGRQADVGPAERRSFNPQDDAAEPPQGAGDGVAPHDHMGPGGDPVEGKR